MSEINSKADRIMDGVAAWASYYRANPHRFAREVLEIHLKPFQDIMLCEMNDSANCFFLGCRGIGKTYLTALFSLIRCILWPGTSVVVVSATRRQSMEIINKIKNIFMDQSKMVAAEIKDIVTNQYSAEVSFHNGSIIECRASNHNSRGGRAVLFIADETRLIPEDIIVDVFRKFLTAPRHAPYMDKPEYAHIPPEPNREVHLTSGWWSNTPCYTRFRDWAAQMLSGKSFFVAALPYQLSIKERLLARELCESDMLSSNFNEVSWTMEMCAEFFEGSDGSLYSPSEINPSRQIKYAFYPPSTSSLLTDKRLKIPPKMHNEVRILSADIALMASTSKADNDATAIVISQMLLNDSGNPTHNIVYTENNEGYKTDQEALTIRRLFAQYDCDKLVIDSRGIGLGVLDKLMEDIYDPETGIVYGALSCYNNPEIASRCRVKNAPKVIYAVLATGEFNSRIALGLRESFKQGRIRTLIPEDDFDDLANDITGYNKLSMEDKIQLKLPYVNTTLMMNELISLQYETRNGVVKVKELTGHRKDRYSALAYCIEVGKELAREYADNAARKTFQDYIFQFRKPKIGR